MGCGADDLAVEVDAVLDVVVGREDLETLPLKFKTNNVNTKNNTRHNFKLRFVRFS